MKQGLSSYDFALSYAHAFRILLHRQMDSRKINNYQDFSLITPLMSTAGFACELFLKSLLTEACKSHCLYSVLFKKLDINTANNIEAIVIHCMQNTKRKIDYDHESFIHDFEIQDKLFEDFRHIFEENNNRQAVAYNIDFTEVLVAALESICNTRFGERPLDTTDI